MRLLDRYLLRELLVPLGYCLTGFLMFWVSSDLIRNLSDFQQKRLTALDIAEYYFWQLPEFLGGVVLPVGLLLALLYALTNHARHQELTAMRAAGLSLWRIAAPYFALGLCLSLAVYALNEHWAPESADRADRVLKRYSGDPADEAGSDWKSELKFRNDRGERLWLIGAYNVRSGEMRRVYVEWKLAGGARRQLLAERAVRTNGVWTFYQVRRFIPDTSPDALPRQEQLDELAVPELSETREQINSEIKISRLNSVKAAKRVQLTIAEILQYKMLHPRLRPTDRAILDTQLQARLAAPWTCLVVVFIAVPFGAPSGRRNVFVGVASSIFIGLAYLFVQKLGMTFGTSNHLPPLLAGWLPNGLFAGLGVWLMTRVR
jgi:lipopolysaccharide export system permease protein